MRKASKRWGSKPFSKRCQYKGYIPGVRAKGGDLKIYKVCDECGVKYQSNEMTLKGAKEHICDRETLLNHHLPK